MRVLRLSCLPVILIITVLVSGGCTTRRMEVTEATPRWDGPPGYDVHDPKIVLLLHDTSKFNDKLVEDLTSWLPEQGYGVLIDRREKAMYYNAAFYSAVVYMARFNEATTPEEARLYDERNNSLGNTIYVFSHMGGGVGEEVEREFDALTAASRPTEVDRAYLAVRGRIEDIMSR